MHDMTIKQRVVHWIRHNLWFFITGLLCIVWFLFRTGTKPSRREYPCQQASIAGANLWLAVYLSPLVSMVSPHLNQRGRINAILGAGIIVAMLIISATYLFDFGGSNPEAFTFTEEVALSDVTSDIFVVNGTSGNDGGVAQLINLMERQGTPFYLVRNGTPGTGLIAKDDVVIIKVNSQWDERGGTNTDLVKALIQAIVDHPDGFNGEIIIADNGQAQNGPTNTGGSMSYTKNNAEDRAQSMTRVASSFSGTYRVSTYLWDTITTKRVHEYAEGDTADGFIVNDTENPRTGIIVSYPKFRTLYGTWVSFKKGIWNTGTGAYEADRLKIINVPVLKAHSQMGVSGAVKHYMGVPSNKLTSPLGGSAHNSVDKGGMGTEMAETRFPAITILDALWVNARPGTGPTSHYDTATRTSIIAASTDPVALDFWAAQNILMPAAKSLGYTDLSTMDPENNSSGKFGNWLRLSMRELRTSGYKTTIDRNAMNVYFVENQPVGTDKIGMYKDGGWYLDYNGNGIFESGTDKTYHWGATGYQPVTGDWNGDGKVKIGTYNPALGIWYLDYNGNGIFDPSIDKAYNWGTVEYQPVTGDWNGDGKVKIGTYNPALGIWYLDYNGNGIFDPSIDKAYNWGATGYQPVTGDWNGDGKVKIGTYNPALGIWYLDYNGNGIFDPSIDKAYNWGTVGYQPVTGDWNGDGKVKIGTYNPALGIWYLDYNGNGIFDPSIDKAYNWGTVGYQPVTGDWNGDGKVKIGTYNPALGIWYLDYNGNGVFDPSIDKAYNWGTVGFATVIGKWS